MKRSGVDFLTGGVLKWLCGGPGGVLPLRLSECSRHARSGAHGMAGALPGRSRSRTRWSTRPVHSRWLNGTPVIPALYAARKGAKIIRRAGIEAIREEEHPPDFAADRARRRARLSRVRAARFSEARRDCRDRRAPRLRGCSGAPVEGHPGGLSGRSRGSGPLPTSSTPTTRSMSLVEAIEEALETSAWERYSERPIGRYVKAAQASN